MTGRLTNLKITEVSGVSGPAHATQIDPEDTEGVENYWLVAKSVSGPLFPGVTAVSEIAALVQKTKLTPALASPPVVAERGDETALQVYKAESGAWAITMPDCKTVRVFSGRGEPGVSVLKSDIEAAETRAIVPAIGFAPDAEVRRSVMGVVERAHHSARQTRDEKGKWRGRFFQRAQSRPKLAGTTYFR